MNANDRISVERSPRRRKWYQFTLAGLFLVTALAAVCVWQYDNKPSAKGPSRVSWAALDLSQFDAALQYFRKEYGAYPPSDFSDADELRIFVQHAFPRYSGDLASLPKLGPAEALVFWLGGYWDGREMCGFAADPLNPFLSKGQSPTAPRLRPVVQFDTKRLFDADGNGFPEYYPALRSPASSAPYVYFAPDQSGAYSGSYSHPGVRGLAVPYRADNGSFINPQSFQIMMAGFDRDFGCELDRRLPSGKGLVEADLDNQTDFAPFGIERYCEVKAGRTP